MSNDATTYIRRAGRGDAIPTRVLVRAGAREAWRLIRHPLHIAGWLLLIAVAWNWPPVAFKYDPYSDVPLEMTALVGIPTFFAASRLATRPRRTGAEESLSSLPTSAETRWAISLTAAVGPFALSL